MGETGDERLYKQIVDLALRPAGNAHCASCLKSLEYEDCTGESGLCSPDRSFELCESCWLDEEKLMDDRGTNDLPAEVARYIRNLASIDE